jgi:RNA polymerase sigma-70 factor, ECF subfamily
MMDAPSEQDPHMDQIALLRAGDEKAFLSLVEQYHPTMVRVARSLVGSAAIAEEVVQEAWMGVLSGIGAFEGRSTLKWWILRILTNCAKSRAHKERRFVPWSAVSANADPDECAVDPDRFLDDSHPRWAGGWARPPEAWSEELLLSDEMLEMVAHAIERLPDGQRQVIQLRDVEELDAQQVCDLLGVSEINQRVLLHRARSRVRAALESYMTTGARAS